MVPIGTRKEHARMCMRWTDSTMLAIAIALEYVLEFQCCKSLKSTRTGTCMDTTRLLRRDWKLPGSENVHLRPETPKHSY